jgi:hypothetical protein
MSKAQNRSKLVLAPAFAILLWVTALSSQSKPETADLPGDVVTKLWKSAQDGRLLSVEGWKDTSRLFAHPSPPLELRSFLVVSDNWSVGPIIAGADKVEVDVNYIPAGEIDSSLRYSPPPKTPYMKTGVAYHLVSVTPHDSAHQPDERRESAGWKIDDPRSLPWTTVGGAIRYVTEVRDKSTHSVLTKNADATLAQLAKLH